MSNVATIKTNLQAKSDMAVVGDMLEKMKKQMAMALPKHITPERMIRVALTAVQNTPKLLQCNRNSLLMAVLRAAQLGLEPDGILGQAYLIPFNRKYKEDGVWKSTMDVQLIVGYKGLIDLARRSGEVSNIIAKEVYANDEFRVDFSQEIPFIHKPLLEGERGEVKFFWAMARFKDGGFHWDYMTKQEVENIRDKGNGKDNKVWHEHFIEMGKKTAIRRIAKYLPMSVQKATILEDLVDAGKNFTHDDFGEIIVHQEEDGSEDTKKVSGNDAIKEKLLAKTGAAASNTEEKQEVVAELLMPGGEIKAFPIEIDTAMLMGALQNMMPPDEKEFVRQNIDAFPAIIKFMREDGKPLAAESLEKIINRK